MYAFRRLAIFVALSTVFVVSGGLPMPGFVGPTEVLAQQFKEPYQFRIRNNSTAASLAIYMKQLRDGSSSSSSAASAGAGASYVGSLTQYSSTTIGNLNEITTILEQGTQGYVNIDTTQDGSGSSQSASSEGTQIFGGNNAIGGDIENAQNTTTGQTTTDESTPQ